MKLETARFEAVRERTQQVLAKAEQLYGVKINPIISFNLKGRVAGWAGCKFCMLTRQATQFTLRFNCELINGKHFEDIMNETVPHEVAHLVCYARPDLGRKHDAGWKRVCMALGGNGKTRHDYDVVIKGRWDYITDRGHKVSVSKRHHAVVQSGLTLTFKKGLGAINKSSPCAPSGQLKIVEKPDNIIVVSNMPPSNPNIKVKTPPALPAEKPKIPSKGETSWASQVRGLIADAKAEGRDQVSVISAAVALGMLKTSAVNCVKANWNKV